MLSVNLYAAARSTALSHRLQRPWPDLPTSLALPWPLGVLMIGCGALAYALPAPASQYFSIGVGGLGGAFVLQGLAVAHALSRGLKLRFVMLIALYACCLLSGEIHPSRPRGARPRRRLRQAARPRGLSPFP